MQEYTEEVAFNYTLNCLDLADVSNFIGQEALLNSPANSSQTCGRISLSNKENKTGRVKDGINETFRPRNNFKTRSYVKTYKRKINPAPKVCINPEVLRKLGYTIASKLLFQKS